MKDFILSVGEGLLSLFVIVGILSAIGIVLMGGANGLLAGIAIFAIVIIATFLLYLLIDIRDKTKETNELLKQILNNSNSQK